MTTEYRRARCPSCGKWGTFRLSYKGGFGGLRWAWDMAEGDTTCPSCGLSHHWHEVEGAEKLPDLKPRNYPP